MLGFMSWLRLPVPWVRVTVELRVRVRVSVRVRIRVTSLRPTSHPIPWVLALGPESG